MHAHAILQKARIRTPRPLGLDYGADVPLGLLERMELAGRDHGLPLAELELLGQCPVHAEGFVQAAVENRVDEYLEGVSWDALEARRRQRVVMN